MVAVRIEPSGAHKVYMLVGTTNQTKNHSLQRQNPVIFVHHILPVLEANLSSDENALNWIIITCCYCLLSQGYLH